MKFVLATLGLTCLLSTVVVVAAQSDAVDESPDLQKRIQTFDVHMSEVKTLNEKLDAVSEPAREAVIYRRDQRAIDLLNELSRIVTDAAKLSENNVQRRALYNRFDEDLAGLTGAIFSWIGQLNERIAQLSADADAASGGAQIALEAYIYSLQTMRIDIYQAAGDVIIAYQAIGLPVSDFLPKLQEQLYLYAETLAGQLELSSTAIDGLQTRLHADSQNANLITAKKTFDGMHDQDLKRLKAISHLLSTLGLTNTDYTELLLREGRELSVQDIGSAAVGQYLYKAWMNFTDTLADDGMDLVFSLLIFFLVLLGFRALSRVVRRMVMVGCERSRMDMSSLLKSMLASISGAAVMVIGVVIALSQVGISLGPMLAGLGVAGFIVGFALQDTLSNFAAGGMILLYRPYDVDDIVEVAGASGLVKKMSLVSTTITTFDNQTVVVPNSKIWGDVIKNVTAQKTRRVDLEFGIGYGDDIEKAENILEDIINTHEGVLKSPAPTIKLHALADSSVNFVVRPWVKTSDYWAVYWDVTREVKMRFDKENISIPFPQHEVHVHRAPVPGHKPEQEQEQKSDLEQEQKKE